jgi:hypothetical protein
MLYFDNLITIIKSRIQINWLVNEYASVLDKITKNEKDITTMKEMALKDYFNLNPSIINITQAEKIKPYYRYKRSSII